MTTLQIGALVLLAAILGRLPKGRQLAMLAASGMAVFWLQPHEPFQALGFWLPIGTLGISVIAWFVTSTPESRAWRQIWPAALTLAAVVLLANSSRFLVPASASIPYATRLERSLAGVATMAIAIVLLTRAQTWQRLLLWALLGGIVVVFVVLKASGLASAAVQWLSSLRPQTDNAYAGMPLAWLGFSYVAFRLMHTVRDRQSGRLPAVSLAEYVNYVIFFPAFTAGPIDRMERFVQDLRSPRALEGHDWIDAAKRILFGLFKKFVIADLLAVISISDVLVAHTKSAAWLWLFLYAFAFRIYFDFSGYTDVAIGMGRLMGIQLPENFASPYLKPDIAQFWNAWHMSLTQWFRSYVFNPLARALRTSPKPPPTWLAILVTQVTTMVLIGLWHGISWSFAAWGLWHGLGLFIHNRWTALSRDHWPSWTQSHGGQLAARGAGVLLTFNFVAVGWLFFELSTPGIAWQTLLRLLGLA